MSMLALNWAFELSITGPKKGVLIALANQVRNGMDCCWPSVSLLSLHAGLSERSVRYALRELEQIGTIRTQGSKGRLCNHYVLDINPANSGINPATDVPSTESNPASPVDQPGISGNDPAPAVFNPAPHAPKPIEPIREPKVEPRRARATRTTSPEDLFGAPPAAARPPAPQPKALRTRGNSPRTGIAADFYPTPAGIAFAAARGITPEILSTEIQKFQDNHQARGTLMADWDAAWRTWAGYFRGYAGKSSKPAKPTGAENAQFMEDYVNGTLPPEPPDYPYGTTIDVKDFEYVEA